MDRFYRTTGGDTDVHCSFEQDKAALGKLESSEFCSEVIAVTGDEVLKQVRVNGTPGGQSWSSKSVRLNIASYLPVDEDGLPLVASVSHLHPSHHQAVHVGTDAVQVDLHVERSAGLHIEFVINQSAVLSDSNIENRNGSLPCHLSSDLQVRPDR